jgi:ketosteroid isomerase-like protein
VSDARDDAARLDATGTPLEFAGSLVAAFAASDAATYFAHFHPEATFLFHDTPGRIESRSVYEEIWAQWEREDDFRVLECASTNQRVQEYADLAVFTHDVRTVRLIGGNQDEVYERETIVLRREGGAWSCVHEHLSPDPARAAAR